MGCSSSSTRVAPSRGHTTAAASFAAATPGDVDALRRAVEAGDRRHLVRALVGSRQPNSTNRRRCVPLAPALRPAAWALLAPPELSREEYAELVEAPSDCDRDIGVDVYRTFPGLSAHPAAPIVATPANAGARTGSTGTSNDAPSSTCTAATGAPTTTTTATSTAPPPLAITGGGAPTTTNTTTTTATSTAPPPLASTGGDDGQPVCRPFDPEALRRVLHAHACLDPRTGYWQGMNFIAGILLLGGLGERQAVAAMRRLLAAEGAGLSTVFTKDLPGVHLFAAQLGRLMGKEEGGGEGIATTTSDDLRRGAATLRAHEAAGLLPDASMLLAVKWLPSLFVTADFPVPLSLAVFDVVLALCAGGEGGEGEEDGVGEHGVDGGREDGVRGVEGGGEDGNGSAGDVACFLLRLACHLVERLGWVGEGKEGRGARTTTKAKRGKKKKRKKASGEDFESCVEWMRSPLGADGGAEMEAAARVAVGAAVIGAAGAIVKTTSDAGLHAVRSMEVRSMEVIDAAQSIDLPVPVERSLRSGWCGSAT